MYKRKDGKVVASLTEVKNKTGDIFALVDEFGEVMLTSYNKPRYRISKIGVAELLEEAKEKSVKSTKKKDVSSKPKVNKEPKVIKKDPELVSKSALVKLKKYSPFNRDSKKEQSFASDARKALQ